MPHTAAFEEQSVDFIVGRQPSWIVRSGISLVFCIMLVLLGVSWFIKYPDKITSNITLTTATPPIALVAKTDGRLIRFFVNNGQTVVQGDKLALIESSVSYPSLQQLQNMLKNINLETTQTPKLLIQGLGELQPAVNDLNLALKELQRFNLSTHLSKRVTDSETLKNQYLLLQEKLRNKRQTMHAKQALEAELLSKKMELKQIGLVTDTEIIEIKNRRLDKKMALEDIDIQLELYNVTLKEIDQQLTEFQLEHADEKALLITNAETKLAALQSYINQWYQKYLIQSPDTGKVSLSSYWSKNQHVSSGETIANILKQDDKKIGKMLIQQQGAGKVNVGQRVNIEIASFPAIEYGYIEGQVDAISLIPGIDGYMIDVAIPNDLTTTTKKKLPFIPNADGSAQIITQEKRLIQRFFDKILYMLNKAGD